MAFRVHLLLLLSALPLSAQPPPPVMSPPDRALLNQVRFKVLDTLNRLPHFVCTQLTERTEYQPVKNHAPELSLADRLRLDVAITGNREMYSWVGDSQLDQKNLFDLVGGGYISTGWFGTFLAAIFRLDRPDFSAAGTVSRNGQSLRQFDFHVPVNRSSYSIGAHDFQRLTSYKGSIFVNPATADLMRLIVETDQAPFATQIREVVNTLEHSQVRLRF